jgi:hypothetical protein
MEDAGGRQINFPAGLIEQPQPFILSLGDKGADKLATVQVFDELSRCCHK